ncbi:hypothetical protein V3481_018944 [Fusarium oxysporum f. sp. vasinfectum]|uniref:DUF3533 domain-containing protein n=1 Tax=Fusarium oxysporum f. sp. vasinfectum 25433 TaxID=1089449 RepID=X0KGF4_FUSOX|nr:hypothetical protein FOTG_18908 [Fusarium oxysporum f. sp. vasinfectum 25433]
MPSIKSLYPRAWDNRPPNNSPVPKIVHKSFCKAVGANFLYLQFLFLGLFCYIFGSLFLQTSHIHNLHVVFVDYDGGSIGRAVLGAYAALQGPTFPSLIERSPSDFPTSIDLLEVVCKTRYWGALYVSPGASGRLQEALTDGTAASAYNNTDVMAYIWNEAMYAPTVDSAISASLELLSGAARVAYSTANGTGNITSVFGPATLSVLADPWQLQSINIQPTSQGSRAIYNTVVIILILIQEFFYLGTINGLYAQFKLYAYVDPYRIIIVRNAISLSYTFIGSLCVISTIWAFKSGWDINGSQFILSWVVLWLFAHINFLTIDVFTIWLPPPFVPMALVSWIIFNVTSTLLPFDLSPAFYRIGYIFPAHELYQVLIDIWSRGCNPQLHYALPILFAWELVALISSALGIFRRCHFAMLGEDLQKKEFKERLDAAVEFEMEGMNETKQKHPEPVKPEAEQKYEAARPEKAIPEGGDEERVVRGELSLVLGQVNTRQRWDQERTSMACNFGPAFTLLFSHEGDNDAQEI